MRNLNVVIWGIYLSVLATVLCTTQAQQPKIDSIELDPPNVDLRFTPKANCYYEFYWGTNVSSQAGLIGMSLGATINGLFVDGDAADDFAKGFYHLVERDITASGDFDQDGINDVFELNHPLSLNPLNPDDPEYDYDEDGTTNGDEITAGRDHEVFDAGVVGIAETSPVHGEGMVALSREVIVRFETTINPATLNSNSVWAIANGEYLTGRIVPSSTDTFFTFYYDLPLPPSTEVRFYFDGDQIEDGLGQNIDADEDTYPGGMGIIEYSTIPLTRLPDTDVFGYVRDSATASPLQGVTIRLDEFPGIFAVTDSTGYFLLEDMPAPEFFVHIDGSTANAPAGMTYPNVGKPFHSVPGQSVQISMDGAIFDIFLPQMSVSDLQSLSPSSATAVNFGADAQTRVESLFPSLDPALLSTMTVDFPAASAQNETGSPATMATIIPVEPSRIPGPLPSNLTPALVVSIQAPGATTFDVPAPVTFPNVENLPPGEKTLIMSFDHDAGAWRVVGPGTVAADGMGIQSDPGVGILAPGWHTALQGTGTEPDKKCTPFWKKSGSWYKVIIASADCLNALLKEAKSLKQIVLAVKIQKQALDVAMAAVKSDASDASVSDAAIRAGFNTVLLLKDPVVDTIFEASTKQASLALRLSECVAGFLGAGSEICDSCYDPSKCKVSNYTQLICLLIQLSETKLSGINTYIESAKEGLRAIPLTLACLAIEQLRDWLFPSAKIDPHGDKGGKGATKALPLDRAAILAEITNYEAASAQLGARIDDLEALADEFEAIANPIGELMEAAEELRKTFPETDEGYYVFTYNGFDLRGRHNSEGGYTQVLPESTVFTLTSYDVDLNRVGVYNATSAPSGFATSILPFEHMDANGMPDTDGDGLADAAEHAIGTSAANPDTDGDGIDDYAEVRQGLDPLSGLAFPVGPISQIDLLGPAHAVAAKSTSRDSINEIAFVATGPFGLALVDSTEFSNPIVMGQIDLPGTAVDVDADMSRRLAVVACSGNGLYIIDFSDPLILQIVGRIPGNVTQVELINGIAFCADGSELISVDIESSRIIHRLAFNGSSIRGLTTQNNLLYSMAADKTLRVIDVQQFRMQEQGSLVLSDGGSDIFAAGNFLYAGARGSNSRGGQVVVDISNPSLPTEIAGSILVSPNVAAGQGVIANGTGLGLLYGRSEVELLNLQVPTNTYNFITRFALPDTVHHAAIGEGVGYVAADGAGFYVINYTSFDNAGIQPSGTLSVQSFSPSQLIEGERILIDAEVADDDQVSLVEFYINGELFDRDISYPFEQGWGVPLGVAGTNYTFEALATDTGGNRIWLAPVSLSVGVDTIPPTLAVTAPLASNSFLSGETIFVDATALDNVGIDSVDVYINGTNVPNQQVSLFQYDINAPHRYGTYTLTVVARDTSGLVSQTIHTPFNVQEVAVSRQINLFQLSPPSAVSRQVNLFQNSRLNAVSRQVSVFQN